MTIQSIVNVATNFLDNLMIAGYSEISLSGVGLSNQVQFLLTMLITGVGGGAIVLVSRFWGQGSTGLDKIKKTLSVGLKISAIISIILWFFVFFFPNIIVGFLTNEKQVIAEAVKYIKVVSFTYLIYSLSTTITSTLSAVESPTIGFIGSLISIIVNMVLNYVFIYGLGPVPSMGATGAAFATLIARICEFIYLIYYLLKIDKKIMFKLSDLIRTDMKTLRSFLKVSVPLILSSGSWGIAMAIQTSFLGHLGQSAIAANVVATNIFQLITVALGATSSSSSIMIGKVLGDEVDNYNTVKIRKYSNTFQLIFLIFGLLTGIIMFISKDFLIGIYSVSKESYDLTVSFVTILSITSIGTAYQMPVLGGIIRGGGDTKFVLVNDIIFMWFLVLPVAYIAAFVLNFSPVVVFAILKSDQILKCAVAFIKVNSYNWIKKIETE